MLFLSSDSRLFVLFGQHSSHHLEIHPHDPCVGVIGASPDNLFHVLFLRRHSLAIPGTRILVCRQLFDDVLFQPSVHSARNAVVIHFFRKGEDALASEIPEFRKERLMQMPYVRQARDVHVRPDGAIRAFEADNAIQARIRCYSCAHADCIYDDVRERDAVSRRVFSDLIDNALRIQPFKLFSPIFFQIFPEAEDRFVRSVVRNINAQKLLSSLDYTI